MRLPQLRALVAALVLAVAFTGCAGETASDPTDTNSQTTTKEATMDAQVPAAGSDLDAAQFATAMTQPDTIILDVRTPAEFAEGHLPEAINADVNAADFAARLGELDKSKNYAIYCRTGNRSGTAMRMMKQEGFESYYHLGGGIVEWSNFGGEIVT